MNFFKKFLRVFSSFPMPVSIRLFCLRRANVIIGEHTSILSGCNINVDSLTIGNNSFIGRNCFIWASTSHNSSVFIGNNVMLAHNVNVCCVSHEIGDERKRAGESFNKSITINDGCWIGTNVTILPGVTIGKSSVVAAGSVVNKDVEANSLYAGVPAKKVRNLE